MSGKYKTIPSARSSAASRTALRIGYVPLIDAAPLIVAHRLGFFSEEGIDVELERQIGWGNVRDKLTFGRLDAAHALNGMPLFSQLGRDWFAEPLVAVMNLGSGGNAITLSRRLIELGVTSASGLAEFIRQDPRSEALSFAHVFSCSMHHYLLREWLSAAGIDPDRDVRLRIFPPGQMSRAMAERHLDGFCVGEPWNTLAERSGAGRIVAVTADIIPNHPEKSLVVSRRWAAQHATVLPRLIGAVLRACAFCDAPENTHRVAQILASNDPLEAPCEIIDASLQLEQRFAERTPPGIRGEWRLRSFSPRTTFPSATHSLWMLRQMRRWGHLTAELDDHAIAARCVDTAAYRTAAEALNVAVPGDDFPPMPLRGGLFDPGRNPDSESAPQEVSQNNLRQGTSLQRGAI